MSQYMQVITTLDDEEEAQRISEKLVKERLAGCVQVIGPIKSTYWWNDEVETTEEWLCLIKSEKDLYEELEEEIKKIHPYDTPEIIYIPISDGYGEYLEWLGNELKETE